MRLAKLDMGIIIINIDSIPTHLGKMPTNLGAIPTNLSAIPTNLAADRSLLGNIASNSLQIGQQWDLKFQQNWVSEKIFGEKCRRVLMWSRLGSNKRRPTSVSKPTIRLLCRSAVCIIPCFFKQYISLFLCTQCISQLLKVHFSDSKKCNSHNVVLSRHQGTPPTVSKLSISLCHIAVNIIYLGNIVAFPFKTTREVAETQEAGRRRWKLSQSLRNYSGP